MKDVKDKVAFITGGASGMGLGMAKVFANNGMKIVIADKRQHAIDSAMEYFKGTGQPVHAINLDVTDREAYVRAADEAEKVFGKIHVLINNAGVGAGGLMVKKSDESDTPFNRLATFKDWDFGLGVNIGGVVNGVVIVVPRIIEHGEGGHIITTSSSGGFSAVPGSGIYCTAKFAVAGMMETLASELEGTNVGASVFFPGPVKTDLGRSSFETRPDHLKNEGQEMPPSPPPPRQGSPGGPPPFDTSQFMDPLEVGEYVMRGIKRNDLFIISHPEFKNGIIARNEALLRAIPDEPFNIKRYDVVKQFGHLLYNPIYEKQTKPGPPEWRKGQLKT
jgi:NAD(P)-dependent dehydrogenase (short-subunit alcohol dehydrogenase family)